MLKAKKNLTIYRNLIDKIKPFTSSFKTKTEKGENAILRYMKMKTLALKLVLALTLIACQSKSNPTSSPITYLALGDSYTIGESVHDSLRWPNQLVNVLNQNGKQFEPATIVAQTGWTTDELAAAIDTTTLAAPYDYVSLLIGVNNQFRGRSIDNFETEFINLLETAITLAGQEGENVFVLSIPDWGVMPFAEGRDRAQIAQEIDQFNSVIQAVCRDKNIAYFDITAISREATTKAMLIAQDGLHPSGTMYAQWVDTVLPFFNASGDE